MASDLLKEFSGTDEFQQSLGQIRDGRQDCEAFFNEALGRLEITLNEAVRQQQEWEEQRQQTQNELDEKAAELQRGREELESQRQQFLNETLATTGERFQERLNELAGALGNTQQQFQNQLKEELDKQRQVLELVLKRLAEMESMANTAARINEFAAQKDRANAEDGSVLSSVLAQFEVLQKDVARRRNETAG